MIVWLYAATLGLSALLLFVVEPLTGKLLLPLLGGTPAVWTTCLCFFQVALLLGYTYAHLVTRWLPPRGQVALQVGLLLLTVAALGRLGVAGEPPPAEASPLGWLVLRLVAGVGLPFFAVATLSPLLQRWYAGSGGPGAHDPYFLYAVSNVGSFVGLLAYPLLIEPRYAMPQQAALWQGGFLLLIVLTSLCGWTRWRAPQHDAAVGADPGPAMLAPPTARRRAYWLLCAFIPASLLLGVTTHLTTNIAAVPLLWIIPLALYLGSFILVFARHWRVPQRVWRAAFPYVFLLGAPFVFIGHGHALLLIPLHLLLFTYLALLCHGELADSRPPPEQLTEFYLWLSLGGVLGGLLNGIVAPLIFTQIYEYPLAVGLAALVLVRPWSAPDTRLQRGRDVLLPLAVLVLVVVLERVSRHLPLPMVLAAFVVCYVIAGLFFRRRPGRFALAVVPLLLVAAYGLHTRLPAPAFVGRNFFGVKTARHDAQANTDFLVIGSTIHGIQNHSPGQERIPWSYFHPSGPLGEVFAAFAGSPEHLQVADIGLGVGAVAAYAAPGDHFTFYDIDPMVVTLAEDTRYFTYLADCRGILDLQLGDGRLQLARAPSAAYGMIVLDAFSSDAIPAHFLTREAVAMYLTKLQPHGVLIFNITNHNLNLLPLLGALADDAGLVAYAGHSGVIAPADYALGLRRCDYVVLARQTPDLRGLPANPHWQRLLPTPGFRVWTDQYSDLFALLQLDLRPATGP